MFINIRKCVASAIVAAAGLVGVGNCQAQILGVPFPGQTPTPNPHNTTPAPQQQQIKHKRVITIVTVLENEKTGQRSTTRLDFTTHVYNPQTKTWILQDYNRSYDAVVARYKAMGWNKVARADSNARIVTGTW